MKQDLTKFAFGSIAWILLLYVPANWLYGASLLRISGAYALTMAILMTFILLGLLGLLIWTDLPRRKFNKKCRVIVGIAIGSMLGLMLFSIYQIVMFELITQATFTQNTFIFLCAAIPNSIYQIFSRNFNR